MGVDVWREANPQGVVIHGELVQGWHARHRPHALHQALDQSWHGLDGLAHIHIASLQRCSRAFR